MHVIPLFGVSFIAKILADSILDVFVVDIQIPVGFPEFHDMLAISKYKEPAGTVKLKPEYVHVLAAEKVTVLYIVFGTNIPTKSQFRII